MTLSEPRTTLTKTVTLVWWHQVSILRMSSEFCWFCSALFYWCKTTEMLPGDNDLIILGNLFWTILQSQKTTFISNRLMCRCFSFWDKIPPVESKFKRAPHHVFEASVKINLLCSLWWSYPSCSTFWWFDHHSPPLSYYLLIPVD